MGNSALGCSHDVGEATGVNNRQLSKHLAVQAYMGFFETAHQTAIAHTIQAGSGVDASNPEATEIALTTTTIAVGVAEGFHHPLVCCTEQGSVATTEATGQPQDLVAAFTGDVASLDAGHEGRVGSGLVERSRLSCCAQ